MPVAFIAALLSLADPTGPPPDTDEVKAIVDQPAQPPAPLVPPAPPPADAVPPPPPSAETVDEPTPTRPPVSSPAYRTAGFGIEMGYAHGGDRFFTVVSPTLPATGAGNSASAGDGVFFSLAGDWTPYWSEGGVGVGVYARAGAKFVGVGDSMTTMSFLRIPLAVGAQLLLPIRGRWFALGRLGVVSEPLQDFTVTSGSDSRSSRDFSARLGEFVDAGISWDMSRRGRLAAIARYERLDVSYSGHLMSANNLGGLGAAYFRF